MINLKWDQTGEKFYETGTDRGVLYPVDTATGNYGDGVAWNGLTGVDESPSGAEANKVYADNQVYLTLMSAEEFGGTVKAYTYPDEFKACNGEINLASGVVIGQQNRKGFGFAYRTIKGNDTAGDAFGYLIHLWYGCKASPSSKSYQTVNDSPEAVELSWEVTTTPVGVSIESMPNLKSTSQITIDSTLFTTDEQKALLTSFEEIIYGKAGQDAVYTVVPSDAQFDSSETYYTKSGTTYTVAEITEFAEGVTYYTKTSDAVPAVAPKLPTPEEVYAHFNAA